MLKICLPHLSIRLALVKDEKEALAKALDRLQMVGVGSTPGARVLREAVRNLEEQLLKERAKNQRSASKRSQEQRILLEQVCASSIFLYDERNQNNSHARYSAT